MADARISVTLPAALVASVDADADREHRSRSNMVMVLLLEARQHRQAAIAPSVEPADLNTSEGGQT